MEYNDEPIQGMREYKQSYTTGVEVHGLVWSRIGVTARDIKESHGAYVFVRNAGTEEIVNCYNMLELAANLVGRPLGVEVEILVRGDAEERVLIGFADSVGAIFTG